MLLGTLAASGEASGDRIISNRDNNILSRNNKNRKSTRKRNKVSDQSSSFDSSLIECDMNSRKTSASRSKPTAGKAATALKMLRERVYETPGFPKLTHKQMAIEANFVNRLGKVSASSYQYNEDTYPKDTFTWSQVQKFMPPLVKRGISEAEISRLLMGVPFSSATPTFHVDFPRDDAARGVPVLSRNTVYRMARGELKLGTVARLAPAAISELEAAGIIMGWVQLPDASDDTVIMTLEDEKGSRVVVDRSHKDLIEGKYYVFLLGEGMGYARYQDGMFISEEGATYGNPVDLNNKVPVVFGQVTWLMEKMG